jgi:hypothetical protein
MKLYKIFVRRKTGKDEGYVYVMSDSILQAKRLLKYNFGWIGSFGNWDEIEYIRKENV